MRGRESRGFEVSHLLFANDTIDCYEASQDQMVHLSVARVV